MLAHKFCDACAWTERPCMSRNELRSSGERIIYARFCEWARLSFYSISSSSFSARMIYVTSRPWVSPVPFRSNQQVSIPALMPPWISEVRESPMTSSCSSAGCPIRSRQ